MKKTFYKTPLIISVSVFSLCMTLLWVMHVEELNTRVALMGASYALICFAFLVFQIMAFARAHIYYDEDVENIKMKVFEVEQDEV